MRYVFFQKAKVFKVERDGKKLGRRYLRGLNVSAKHPQVGIKRQFGRLNHRAAVCNQRNGHCRSRVNVKCGMGESEVSFI